MDSIGQRDRAATSMSLGNITAVNLKKQHGESGDTCPNIRYIKYKIYIDGANPSFIKAADRRRCRI